MYLLSLAARKVLPISDAYCGISQSLFGCRKAVQCLRRLQRDTQQRHTANASLGFAVGQAVFAHPQVGYVMVLHQVIQARQHWL